MPGGRHGSRGAGASPSGGISAQIDALHLERYADATGFFGMLDAEDRQDAFAALLGTAERWLRDNGMRRVRGPFGLSINEEAGLLIEGFDTPPVFMMGHARPYYSTRIEAQGYRKAVDTLAYTIHADFQPSPVMAKLVAAAQKRVHVRPLDRKRFDAEIALLRDIFNDAWAENWGFLPFTDAEFTELGRNLRFLVDPGLIRIAEVDGEPAAFMVVIPNLNEAIRGLDGRLLPFGWAKLLWRLKVRHPKHRPRPADGRAAEISAHAPRSRARLPRDRRRAAQDPGARRQGSRAVVDPGEQRRHAQHHRVDQAAHAYKRYRIYERELDAD